MSKSKNELKYIVEAALFASEVPLKVGALIKLFPHKAAPARDEIKALLARRAATQPTGQRSCGSVFRNPPGDYAGRLIEAAGLKGTRLGGAVGSPKHANFIINDNNAAARDIESLIELVKATVLEKFDVQLVPEVRVVGEAA